MKSYSIFFVCIILGSSLLAFAFSAEEKKLITLTPGESCISQSCHAVMGKKKYVHMAGVDGKQCHRCHETVKEDEHVFKKMTLITKPLCEKCHSEEFPVSGELKKELKKSPPVVISKDKDRKLHAPFAEGKCTECHDAHESDFYRHLKFQYPEGLYASFSVETYTLCIKCHKGFDQALTEPRTLSLTLFRNGNRNLHYLHVNKTKGRTCAVCHHPHGLDNFALIRDNVPFGNRMLPLTYEKKDDGGKCATTCHRTAEYDRYNPVFNMIKTSPLPGTDATTEELKHSREEDLKRQAEKAQKPAGATGSAEEPLDHGDKTTNEKQ